MSGSESSLPNPSAGTRPEGTVRALGGRALVYGIGTALQKALGLLLLPVYSRYLTPADLGVVAVTGTITAALNIVLPIGLHGALTYLYFKAPDEPERRRNVGTVWVGLTASSILLAASAEGLASVAGTDLFRGVPFDPYVRIAIWTSLAQTWALVPLNLLQIQERPGAYVGTALAGTCLTAALILYLVVGRGMGAYGYVLALLIGAGAMTVPYVGMMLRYAAFPPSRRVLGEAFAYGAPLIAHQGATWLLLFSDRVLLERYVPLADVGTYLVACQLASGVTLVATSMNTTWVPFLFKMHKERGSTAAPELARIASYMAFGLTWSALALALFAGPLVRLLLPPSYGAAARLVPWSSMAMLLGAFYLIPVSGLFLGPRTVLVAVCTMLSGVVDAGLNLLLLPRYGVSGAAWSSVAGNCALMLSVWVVARRVYPLPYEYRRIAAVVASAALLFGIGTQIHVADPAGDVGIRALLLLAHPVVLAAMGVFTAEERGRLRRLLGGSSTRA